MNSEQHPVDAETGERLYQCLACGRIFTESEEPCGLRCPVGYEDAFALGDYDGEYEWREVER